MRIPNAVALTLLLCFAAAVAGLRLAHADPADTVASPYTLRAVGVDTCTGALYTQETLLRFSADLTRAESLDPDGDWWKVFAWDRHGGRTFLTVESEDVYMGWLRREPDGRVRGGGWFRLPSYSDDADGDGQSDSGDENSPICYAVGRYTLL